MTAATTAVKNDYLLSKAMIVRDKQLYENENGLVDFALEIKNYVKSLFSEASTEYRQIKANEFSRSEDN